MITCIGYFGTYLKWVSNLIRYNDVAPFFNLVELKTGPITRNGAKTPLEFLYFLVLNYCPG